MVGSRTNRIVHEAAQSNAIVSSLFPEALRDRLFDGNDGSDSGANMSKAFHSGKHGLKNFLLGNKDMDIGNDNDEQQHTLKKHKPIADLFPETTIMFAGKFLDFIFATFSKPEKF